MGRQRPGAGGLRPVGGRRHARPITARSCRRDFEALCRAELRIDGPGGAWTARFASTIYDEPAGARLGRPRAVRRQVRLPHVWLRRPDRRAPLVAPFGDAPAGGFRLASAGAFVVQSEIETFALEPDGTVAWRIAHCDVVTDAELVGGRLVLTSYGGAYGSIRDGSPDGLIGGCAGETVDNHASRTKLVDKAG